MPSQETNIGHHWCLHWTKLVVCVVILLDGVPGAHADTTEDNRCLIAVQVYNEANDLMKKSRYEEACLKLEDSLKLCQPDKQYIARYRLAECQEKLDKLASASKNYQAAADDAKGKDDAFAKHAKIQASALKHRVIHLVVVVTPDVRKLPNLKVTRDGNLLKNDELGKSLPVDPGTHTIAAEAPGYKPWARIVHVNQAGHTIPVTIPPLERLTPAPIPPIMMPSLKPSPPVAPAAPTPKAVVK